MTDKTFQTPSNLDELRNQAREAAKTDPSLPIGALIVMAIEACVKLSKDKLPNHEQRMDLWYAGLEAYRSACMGQVFAAAFRALPADKRRAGPALLLNMLKVCRAADIDRVQCVEQFSNLFTTLIPNEVLDDANRKHEAEAKPQDPERGELRPSSDDAPNPRFSWDK